MGGFKESMAPTSSRGAWTPTTRTDGRSWVDASPSRRCAVCGGDSWCQTHREGGTVLCKRVGNGGREKMNRDGVMYWVHRLSGPVRESMEPLPPAAERAPLDRARLRAPHQPEALNERGDVHLVDPGAD